MRGGRGKEGEDKERRGEGNGEGREIRRGGR